MKTKAVKLSEIVIDAGTQQRWLDFPVLHLFDEYTLINDLKMKRDIETKCITNGGTAFIEHNKRLGFVWHTLYLNGFKYEKPIAEEFKSKFSDCVGVVYFIRCGEFVKIGYTRGEDAKSRLQSLQTGNPQALELLATAIGDMSDERALHKEFDEYRTAGEWFRNTGRLAAHIVTLTRGEA